MSISMKTRKMLWGRSASRCNFENCRCELVIDATDTDKESLVGEECHIIAREEAGPRGLADLTEEQRDKYDNLILLCNLHHKLIDDQPNLFTVEVLNEMKRQHIEWVNASLNIDLKKQKDDEVYTMYIDNWLDMISIDQWQFWTSDLLMAGPPRITIEMDENLKKLKEWLLSRIWPKRYPELDAAFENFRCVLESLYMIFHEHAIIQNETWVTKRFYDIDKWDPELYEELFNEYRYHVDLVNDLTLELTRAANYVCDKIRKCIISSFRLKEGVLLVMSGPYMDLSFKTYSTEYRDNEREPYPYKGLEAFKKERENRDVCMGVGISHKDLMHRKRRY